VLLLRWTVGPHCFPLRRPTWYHCRPAAASTRAAQTDASLLVGRLRCSCFVSVSFYFFFLAQLHVLLQRTLVGCARCSRLQPLAIKHDETTSVHPRTWTSKDRLDARPAITRLCHLFAL